MFWKNKPKIDLEEDPRHADNRDAFRISPDKNRPLIITIDGSPYAALNISGTGVCFRSDSFSAGSRIGAMVCLPSVTSEDQVFPVKLDVVSSENGLCRCRFVEIHIDAQNLLHSYILGLQKKNIRRNQMR